MNYLRNLSFFLIVTSLLSCEYSPQSSPSFDSDEGIIVFENFSGEPDSMGVIHEFPLDIPAFSSGGYFSGDGGGLGYLPGNRNHLWLIDSEYKVLNKPEYGKKPPFYLLKSPAGRLGTFTMFHLDNGQYLCILPLSGLHSMSWIEFNERKVPILKIGSMGTEKVEGAVPVIAWAKSGNFYEASFKVWEKVLEGDVSGVSTNWRNKKEYPVMFNYLGWCTWEEFNRNINDSLITSSVRKIKESEIPVRFVLIDDGHEWIPEENDLRLRSFTPDPKKFPNGWEPLISMKNPNDIKWMGLWHHQAGYFNGLAKENDFGALNDKLITVASGKYLPKPEKESIQAFYEHLFGSVKNAGFDFTKVDFQSAHLRFYMGESNAVNAHILAARSMEEVLYEKNLGLLNCIAQDMVSVSNTSYSSVTRCSQDYRKGSLSNARIKMFQSYNNLLWMGHTVWGDHDMFHSSDTVNGRLMAVSKAMSGGPIYLSDHPDHFAPEFVMPVCYSDGQIIRTLAPALPLPESLFNNPLHEKVPYRVIAPLPNKAASIVCYNLYETKEEVTVKAYVSEDDYHYASALIQPYPGKWHLPEEGIILYDWYKQKIFDDEKIEFQLTGFTDKLIHLCPVKSGVAVIGRIDKYMSPATVNDIKIENNQISFTMKESGPFAFYLKKGRPVAENIRFEKRENGLWLGFTEKNIQNYIVNINIK